MHKPHPMASSRFDISRIVYLRNTIRNRRTAYKLIPPLKSIIQKYFSVLTQPLRAKMKQLIRKFINKLPHNKFILSVYKVTKKVIILMIFNTYLHQLRKFEN